MISKDKVIPKINNIIVITMLGHHISQDFDLNFSLEVELLLASNDFESNMLFSFMIKNFNDLQS
jgi:hypothetical protein